MEQQVVAGTMSVVLEHKLMHGLSIDEQQRISQGFVVILKEKFDEYLKREQLPISITPEILDVRAGCIEAKLKIVIQVLAVAGSLATIVAKYPEIRAAIPLIVHDSGAAYSCYIKKIQTSCIAQVRDSDLARRLYEVKQGDTLSRIVKEQWHVSDDRVFKVMDATVRLNAKAFVDGDMNQLKAGALLAQPTDKMIRSGVTP